MDFESLSNLDVCPSLWKYPEQGAKFKQKCFQVLMKRALAEGSLDGIDIVNPVAKNESFESFMCDRVLSTFDYTNVCVYESTIDAMNALFPDIDSETVKLASELMLEYIPEDNEEYFNSTIDFLIEEEPDYDSEFGEVYIDREDVMNAIRGFNLVHEGEYEKALEYDVVREMARGYSELFKGVHRDTTLLTKKQAVQCFNILGDMFNMSENFSAKIHIYKSFEIYDYMHGYRDNVPENIRSIVDKMIDVVSCPANQEAEGFASYNNIWDPEEKSFLVVLELIEQHCELKPVFEGDFAGIWKSAMLTLDRELPRLRMKYGKTAA